MNNRYSALFTVIASMLSTAAGAQQILLSEPFDQIPTLNIYGGWTHSWTGGVPWRAELPYLAGSCMGVPGPNGTNKVAYINDCAAFFPNQSNVLMATPPINLSGISGAYLRFLSSFKGTVSGSIAEKATVEASTDGGLTWTVLLNVPANPVPGYYRTVYINLSAYTGVSNLKIGFRYSDGGGSMIGWAVDNIKVYVPPPRDMMLVQAFPDEALLSYCKTGDSVELKAIVHNAGTAPVTDFTIAYREGSGPVYATQITGITIAPFDSLTVFPDKYFVMPNLQQHNLKMWVDLAGDTIYHNDTLALSLRGAAFIPRKKVAIEEGTGTWNMFGPQGIVFLKTLAIGDNGPSIISIHDADPMMAEDYAGYLFDTFDTYIPYFFLDRRTLAEPQDFFAAHAHLKSGFGFADISIEPEILSPGYMQAVISVTPALPLQGIYRLALIVTEDDVHGSGVGWDQKNWYAGKGIPMGGFESKADPVPAAEMYYDYVARPGASSYWGEPCLPLSMQASQTYQCTLQAPLDPAWNKQKMRAVALLIRSADSSILNSATVSMAGLSVASSPASPELAPYPNPANETVNIAWSTGAMLSIVDMLGRSVAPPILLGGRGGSIALSTAGWAPGIYTLALQTPQGKTMRKLLVLH